MIRLFFQFDLLVFIAAIELINHGGFQANNAKFNRFPNIYFHWIGKYFDWIAHSLIFKIDIIWMQLLEVGFKLFFYHKFRTSPTDRTAICFQERFSNFVHMLSTATGTVLFSKHMKWACIYDANWPMKMEIMSFYPFISAFIIKLNNFIQYRIDPFLCVNFDLSLIWIFLQSLWLEFVDLISQLVTKSERKPVWTQILFGLECN